MSSWSGRKYDAVMAIFQYSFIQNAFIAGSAVAVVAGIVGYFLVTRGLTFAGHALSHIGFAGAAGALLFGIDPLFGMLIFTIIAGIGIGALRRDLHEEDINIGVIMMLMLGLGALFIALYNGYAEQAYSILFGTILGISRTDVFVTLGIGVAAVAALAFIFRPLLFSSIDPEVAAARGVPVRALGIVFLIIVAVAVSMSVQVVGVLLIFTLLVGPAAVATRLATRPLAAVALSIAVGLAFTWSGILAAVVSGWPVAFCIATVAFAVYLPVRLATADTGRGA